jgi:DNA-binding NtrC family response regulator
VLPLPTGRRTGPAGRRQERGGTVFLNEVASLSPGLQLQLLRILQEAEFEHGPGRSALADARFVMSSSENLPALVDQGKFRQDLYYRIAVICLKLPPLRHRGNDIETLAEHFRARFATSTARRSSASPATPSTHSTDTTGRATSASSKE